MVSARERQSLVAALAGRYSLAMPRRPIGGVIGQMLGSSVGSSLEFQDHRHYSPGDDPRHIDWAAYARTDQLAVRLFREEVSPRLEIVVDASVSMTTGDKAPLLQSLLLLLVRLADKGRAQPVLWIVNNTVQPVRHDLTDAIERLPLTGRVPLAEQLSGSPVGLRPRSIRVVVSDFLFPHDAESLVRRVASGAAAITLIQLVSVRENAPVPGEPVRLIDVESGETLDVSMDPPTVAGYMDRLESLRTNLSREARRAAGSMASVTDAMSLEEICRDHLTPAGLLEVK